jgi:16S rRNA (adenine1518-N6/adenine1519-N6)-dimethyltransferase
MSDRERGRQARGSEPAGAASEAFPDPRTLLKRHGLAAKKSWGQNFLIAESVYRAIVDCVVRDADDWIVTLTMRLAERVPEGMVIAVERDRDLVAVLEKELGHLDNVEVHPANALEYDLGQVARWHGGPVSLCGNLPYQIASPLLFHFIEARQHLSRIVVMIQKEMAERLVARPGTSAYGAMGVILGAFADIELVARARATAFAPAPKVDSAVVCMVPLAAPRVEIGEPDHFRQVVHGAFGQRRKVLRNSLRARFAADAVDQALTATGIDGGRRGETLSLDELAALSRALPPVAADA